MSSSTSAELSRRELLSWGAYGLTGAALSGLLQGETGSRPTHTPSARRVIHVCLMGGLSHLDSFDYKPELAKFHGKPFKSKHQPETFFNRIGPLRMNDWAFKRHGQSGLWISDLFPYIATVADELTVVRSMVADSANHTPATFQQNTGFQLNGFPVMGSWVSYGLGSESDDLPAYVVLPDSRGYPAAGHPEGEAVHVVVAAFAQLVGGRLREGSATELGGEEHEGIVEHAPAAQVLEECGYGPVDAAGLAVVVADHVLVPVPVDSGGTEGTAGDDLHEAHALFEKAAGK